MLAHRSMGEAVLLAYGCERQVARAMAAGLRRAAREVLAWLGRPHRAAARPE